MHADLQSLSAYQSPELNVLTVVTKMLAAVVPENQCIYIRKARPDWLGSKINLVKIRASQNKGLPNTGCQNLAHKFSIGTTLVLAEQIFGAHQNDCLSFGLADFGAQQISLSQMILVYPLRTT